MARGSGGFERPPVWALIVAGFVVAAVAVISVVVKHPQVPFRPPSAAATTSTSAAAPQPVAVNWPAGGPLRALWAGDSLTGGLYASTQQNAYKWLMLAALQQHGRVQEYNTAVTGGTAVEVSKNYQVPSGLNLAVVELGTNDRAVNTPIADFTAAYDSLLTRITSGSPGVALVCAGIWEQKSGQSTSAYNSVIQKTCTARGGQFVTLTPIYDKGDAIGPVGKPAYGGTSDDFHPNDTGHREIAQALLAQLNLG